MLEKWLRDTLSLLLKGLFRLEVRGLEHYTAVRGDTCVVIANHQSFLDPMILAVVLPDKPAFAMNVFQAKKWYFRPMLKIVEVFRVDPTQPMSMKSMIQRLKAKGTVVVFPEGRITLTGGVMKMYEGTGMIIDRTQARVLTVWIEGAKYSKLSRLQGKLRLRWFPKITVTFQPPVAMDVPAQLGTKARRDYAARWMYDRLTEAAFRSADWNRSVLEAIIEGAQRAGYGRKIVTDATRAELSYRALFMRVGLLAEALAPRLGEAKHVGVLLPTALGGIVTFLALHAARKVPAMLNFSAGSRNLVLACEMAQVETVLTSRAFIEKGNLGAVVEALSQRVQVLYLEDVRAQIGMVAKLRALGKSFAPRRAFEAALDAYPDDTAVVVYTSGSEGTPKGVALSHANLLANIQQAASRLSFTEADVMFNALPIFHSFGLTIGALLPLVLGIRTVLFPSPLQYRVIPEAIYDAGATIVLGTDTFYNGWARYAHPFDFFNVRLAVAGAERLKESTRQLYQDRFRLGILQGYGVTETSPAISFNTPLENRPGTVGRVFPGMEWKLEPVEGLARGGRFYIKGPNVMLGYIKADKPGVLQPQGEWYDTGDIVEVDAQGFLTILGRAKRFAKIGGEMVSLAVVEECAAALWPEAAHAALALADERKGEIIVLVSEAQEATREAVMAHAREQGIPEIALPKRVQHMETLPRLGSGKLDYVRLKELFS